MELAASLLASPSLPGKPCELVRRSPAGARVGLPAPTTARLPASAWRGLSVTSQLLPGLSPRPPAPLLFRSLLASGPVFPACRTPPADALAPPRLPPPAARSRPPSILPSLHLPTGRPHLPARAHLARSRLARPLSQPSPLSTSQGQPLRVALSKTNPVPAPAADASRSRSMSVRRAAICCCDCPPASPRLTPPLPPSSPWALAEISAVRHRHAALLVADGDRRRSPGPLRQRALVPDAVPAGAAVLGPDGRASAGPQRQRLPDDV